MNEEKRTGSNGPDGNTDSEKEMNENISQQQTIEPTQPETQDSKLQTGNMEVHHHPDLHHKRKKFKEYFLEFLMIYLAVTLGFFAESYREYLSDKEKEYIESLVEDLKIDQQILSQNIAQLRSGISMMDSVILLLDHPSLLSNNTGELYFLARLSPRLQPLPVNDRTFEQLKNSGNFRLIKNISSSNKIM